jgi:biopolymer transport protein ExbB/TolQ
MADPTAAAAAAAAVNPNFIQQFAKFMELGGFWMFPILMVLMVGVAIFLERFYTLSKVERINRSIWNEVFPLLTRGQLKQALDIVKNSDSAIGHILTNGLTHSLAARRHDDVEVAMEEALMEVLPRLEKRTPYLSTLANVATLLGLLGTIIGLIHAFGAVASADPSEKANLLSKAVSEAMNCTAFGLVTAIPMLIVFTVLQSKTGQVVGSLEAAAMKYMNIIRQLSAQSAQHKGE